jgi:hypothetical protein
MTTAPSRSAGPFLWVLVLWFLAACAAGVTGRVAMLHPPLPQVIIALLTAALIAAGVANAGFREWLAEVNLRPIVALHVTRFVGFAFLEYAKRGLLPREFAVPAGWGDILVATVAINIVMFLPRPASKPWLLLAWNALGLADILNVVFTAARLAMADPASMRALMQFPMSVVPTFLVPLIIASHVLVFWRLRRLARAEHSMAKHAASRKRKA